MSVLVAGRDLVAGQEHRRASLQVSLEMGYGINFMAIYPGETDDTNQINHGIPLPLSPKTKNGQNQMKALISRNPERVLSMFQYCAIK